MEIKSRYSFFFLVFVRFFLVLEARVVEWDLLLVNLLHHHRNKNAPGTDPGLYKQEGGLSVLEGLTQVSRVIWPL